MEKVLEFKKDQGDWTKQPASISVSRVVMDTHTCNINSVGDLSEANEFFLQEQERYDRVVFRIVTVSVSFAKAPKLLKVVRQGGTSH
jgi:hypothetical protein